MNKELKKLKRTDLLEIMLLQNEKIEALEKELEEKNKIIENRNIIINNSGSIAEASLKIMDIFNQCQKAADLYLENIKKEEKEERKEEIVKEEKKKITRKRKFKK